MATPTLTRAQLATVFKDQRVLLAFDAFQKQLSSALPDQLTALESKRFVVGTPDALLPNALVLTAGTGLSASSGVGTISLALNTTGVTAGNYTYASFSVDANGRLTAASSNATVGTGSIVRSNSPTLSGTLTAATVDAQTLLKGKGTATNDSAAAGYIGEYISQYLPVGSAVALTSGAPQDITSISLTAGDWDVWGNVAFVNPGGTMVTQIVAAIGTTSGVLPTNLGDGAVQNLAPPNTAGFNFTLSAGFRRLSLAATTTVYLQALASFTVSTLTAYGFIGARRAR